MIKKVRVNVRTLANSAGIRREKRNGRDYIIVPSATMPDGVVMNGVRYPAEEIAKAFHTLERKPAPLGHPNIEGAFVSASDPEGLARGWVGAWNENVRREGGRVHLDKVIDVATAQQLAGGKAVLEAIEKGEPIHTSTGLYAMMEEAEANAADGAKKVAREIVFDHDAILLGEDGAATPAQGVGMLVNAAVDASGQRIEAMNCSLVEDAERGLNWAVEDVLRQVERLDRASKIDQLKAVLLDAIKGVFGRETSTTNEKESTVDKAQIDALSAEVKSLSQSVATMAAVNVGELVKNAIADAMKPVTEIVNALQNAEKAKEQAELDGLREAIVESGMMPAEVAGELTLNAARAIGKNLPAKGADPATPRAYALHSAAPKPAPAGGGYKVPKAED